jgi:nitroreductase family protein
MVRDLAAGFTDGERGQAVFETDPVVAVLTTPAEDPAAWVQTGIALQHLLLVATSYGLTASFLDQLVHSGEDRRRIRALIGVQAWPQVVLRLGFPAEAGERAGRRDWHESYDQWF